MEISLITFKKISFFHFVLKNKIVSKHTQFDYFWLNCSSEDIHMFIKKRENNNKIIIKRGHSFGELAWKANWVVDTPLRGMRLAYGLHLHWLKFTNPFHWRPLHIILVMMEGIFINITCFSLIKIKLYTKSIDKFRHINY